MKKQPGVPTLECSEENYISLITRAGELERKIEPYELLGAPAFSSLQVLPPDVHDATTGISALLQDLSKYIEHRGPYSGVNIGALLDLRTQVVGIGRRCLTLSNQMASEMGLKR
ncbi:MAG: hypothetical protein Q7S65_01820 [Nanoarchaeota archaeon]|nr:hypothetical protein [Nanoarchaeota archaeon]